MATTGRRRPGTPSKGARAPITSRVPTDHRDVYEKAAADEGLALSDYVALVMARAHGLDEPSYLHRHRNQGELPLGA